MYIKSKYQIKNCQYFFKPLKTYPSSLSERSTDIFKGSSIKEKRITLFLILVIKSKTAINLLSKVNATEFEENVYILSSRNFPTGILIMYDISKL